MGNYISSLSNSAETSSASTTTTSSSSSTSNTSIKIMNESDNFNVILSSESDAVADDTVASLKNEDKGDKEDKEDKGD